MRKRNRQPEIGYQVYDIGSGNARRILYTTQGGYAGKKKANLQIRMPRDPLVDACATDALISFIRRSAYKKPRVQTLILATECLRSAENADAVCRRVKAATQKEIRILSAMEEMDLYAYNIFEVLNNPQGIGIHAGNGSSDSTLLLPNCKTDCHQTISSGYLDFFNKKVEVEEICDALFYEYVGRSYQNLYTSGGPFREILSAIDFKKGKDLKYGEGGEYESIALSEKVGYNNFSARKGVTSIKNHILTLANMPLDKKDTDENKMIYGARILRYLFTQQKSLENIYFFRANLCDTAMRRGFHTFSGAHFQPPTLNP